jgi:hypothetical protein
VSFCTRIHIRWVRNPRVSIPTGPTAIPIHYAGSTGFNQDGPGKNWLKAAELKFSWPPPAELESSAGQAS